MKATYRVKNLNNETVGFLVDNTLRVIPTYIVKDNIGLYDNLSINKRGIIRAGKKLPSITIKDINYKRYRIIDTENAIQRDIQVDMETWKRKYNKQALKIDGARQIGKTTEIMRFAYKNYENVIYVNAATDNNRMADLVDKFGNCLNVAIETYCRVTNNLSYENSGNTVIILDEIQADYRLYNLIRTLNTELDCDLIVTGSYLGKTLGKEFFQPAGNITTLRMFPLSFREFCRALNRENKLMNIDIYGGSQENDYKELMETYNIYKKIGGYPGVVSRFIQTKSVEEAQRVIKDLLLTFERESMNYFLDMRDNIIFRSVYMATINYMCREKRGTGGEIPVIIQSITKKKGNKLITKEEIKNAIVWLEYSGIIGRCMVDNKNNSEVTESGRMYFMDCGVASVIIQGTAIDKATAEGFITENFAYTELSRLYSDNRMDKQVKYQNPAFSVFNEYEVDFFIWDKNNTSYGIEVKAGKGNPVSLKEYIKHGLVNRAILACNTIGAIGIKGVPDKIPIYTLATHFPYKTK